MAVVGGMHCATALCTCLYHHLPSRPQLPYMQLESCTLSAGGFLLFAAPFSVGRWPGMGVLWHQCPH